MIVLARNMKEIWERVSKQSLPTCDITPGDCFGKLRTKSPGSFPRNDDFTFSEKKIIIAKQ